MKKEKKQCQTFIPYVPQINNCKFDFFIFENYDFTYVIKDGKCNYDVDKLPSCRFMM